MQAKDVHKQLAQMVAAKDVRLLGEANKHLQKILDVYVRILGKGTTLVEGAVGLEMARQMQEIASVVPPEMLQALASQLPAPDQANLQVMLHSPVACAELP